MPLILSDEQLREAGLSEREARIELACRLFDIGRLPLWPAARVAGMDRVEFEAALMERDIPIYRPTLDDIAHDMDALERLTKHSCPS